MKNWLMHAAPALCPFDGARLPHHAKYALCLNGTFSDLRFTSLSMRRCIYGFAFVVFGWRNNCAQGNILSWRLAGLAMLREKLALIIREE